MGLIKGMGLFERGLLERMTAKQRATAKRAAFVAIGILAVSLLLELGLFNFRHWQSLTLPHVEGYDVSYGPGIRDNGDGTYSVTDEDQSYVELTNVNAHVGNLRIPVRRVPSDKGDAVAVQISATDAANGDYFDLPDTEVVDGLPETEYVTVHLVGESTKLRVYVKGLGDQAFTMGGIAINSTRPLVVRLPRMALVALCLLLFGLFRPGSRLYRTGIDLGDRRQKLLLGGVVALNVLVILGLWGAFYDTDWQQTDWPANLQYDYLARSLSEGHAWLDFDPPSALATMSNPYDPTVRAQTLKAVGQSNIADFAYYNGRYYSYFGIVPVLLFYLPYHLATGQDLSTGYVVCLFAVLFALASFFFVHELVRRHFPRTSLGLYLLLSTTFVAGSGMLYCVQFVTLYGLPILMGITLDVAGLGCWLRASDGAGGLSKLWLTLGGACIATVMGCRPQLVLAVLFAFPLFWQDIRERRFFSREGLANTLCVMGPFLVVGAGVMYYNHLRFGSPFDFGATYNLTSVDMTHRGFVFDRFWLGLWEYFFQPFRVAARFPYLFSFGGTGELATDFQGQTINEPLLGGYFAFNIFGLYWLLVPHARTSLHRQGVLGLAACSIVIGLVVVGLDIQMVGMTLRYLTDFSIFFNIAAVCVILSRFASDEVSVPVSGLVVALCCWTIFINLFSLLAAGRYNEAQDANPYLYYFVKDALFWR